MALRLHNLCGRGYSSSGGVDSDMNRARIELSIGKIMPSIFDRTTLNSAAIIALSGSVAALILGTRVNLFGLPANMSIVGVAGVFLLQLAFFNKEHIAQYRRIAPYILICTFLAAYSAMMQYSLHGLDHEFHFPRIALNFILYLAVAVGVANVINSLSIGFGWLFGLVFFVAAANSLVLILEFNFPTVRIGIENWLVQSEDSNIDYMNVAWRLRGLAAEGGASLSVFMVLGVAAGTVAVHLRCIPIPVFIIGSSAILVALISVARTGLYMSAVLLAIFIAAQLIFNLRNTWRPLLGALIATIIYFWATADNYNAVAPWAFELFNNFILTGQFRTASTDDLFTMLPSNPSSGALGLKGIGDWVFGIGFFDGEADFRSDSGYMKTVYSVGIIGALMMYGMFAYHLAIGVGRRIGVAAYVWIVFLGLLYISEIKEPFMYQNYAGRSLVMIMVGAYLIRTIPGAKGTASVWRATPAHA